MHMNNLSFEVQSTLPTTWGDFRIYAFKSDSQHFPHVALVADGTDFGLDQGVNVRIHSECMTGDLFGSTRCDCGDQLNFSLRYISSQGGVLLYLRQEGRGIGLVNKLHAYNLQDGGLDTFEANRHLGFHDDERDFSVGIRMLHALDIFQVNVITNNPEKLQAFEGTGIVVRQRIPVEIQPNGDNANYLRAKKLHMGHLLTNV